VLIVVSVITGRTNFLMQSTCWCLLRQRKYDCSQNRFLLHLLPLLALHSINRCFGLSLYLFCSYFSRAKTSRIGLFPKMFWKIMNTFLWLIMCLSSLCGVTYSMLDSISLDEHRCCCCCCCCSSLARVMNCYVHSRKCRQTRQLLLTI